MGKKKAPSAQAVVNVKQFWCYYCDTRHEDEYKLIQHQRSKHFLCKLCDPNAYGRNCLSLSGLVSHVRRSHRKEIKEVPCAIPGRESLEVEVSAMQNIPEEALAEFQAKLAEEMQEAQNSVPEPEPAAEEPQRTAFQAHQQQQQQQRDSQQWDQQEMPPIPEEPPQPKRVHTPIMPHFAELAHQLANQMASQDGQMPDPFKQFQQKEEPVAFDPSMLAARLKAAEEEAKRTAEADLNEEKVQEERKRLESPRRRPRTRSRSRRPPPPEEDEGASVTYEVSGKLGMACEPDTGIVAELLKDGKAGKLGVKTGWQIVSLDDQPYTAALLGQKNNSGDPYRITFVKKAVVDKRRRSPEGDPARSAPSRGPPPARYRSRSRGGRSRSRKPQRGSLKFRPRSMNRSEERQKRRTNLEERESRGIQNMGSSDRPRDDDRRREDRSERGAPRESDDRRTKDYLRRREETDKDYSRRGDDRRRGGDDDRYGEDDRRREKRPRDRSRSERREEQPPEPPPEKKRRSKWGPDEVPEEPVMPMAQMMSMGTKTELCMAFTEGLCTKGEMCVYAHSLRELAPGGYKPRLCPSFMRGNCPRKTQCLYAHNKEELPPNFKCILCRNYTSGFCRKQQICTLAHGEEEQGWFMKFMADKDAAAQGQQQQLPVANNNQWGNMPKAPGLVGAQGAQGAIMDGGGLADNVMMAAQKQLMSGTAQPGQLALEMPKAAPLKPSFQPKINLANNPAMKAAQMQAAMKASSCKAGSVPQFGMPMGPAPSFAKSSGPPLQDVNFAKGGPGPAPVAPKPWVPPGAGAPVAPRPWVPPGATALENKIALAMGKAPASGATAKGAPPTLGGGSPSGQQPCMRFEMGGCSLGADCPFSHIVNSS